MSHANLDDDPVQLAQALIQCPSVTPDDAGALDTLSLALRSITDVNMADNSAEEDAAPKKGASINVVRYGVQSSMTTQK